MYIEYNQRAIKLTYVYLKERKKTLITTLQAQNHSSRILQHRRNKINKLTISERVIIEIVISYLALTSVDTLCSDEHVNESLNIIFNRHLISFCYMRTCVMVFCYKCGYTTLQVSNLGNNFQIFYLP